MEATDKFDAIVIGSGMGGMAVASHLAQSFSAKVLLIEKHGKIGGFTHVFNRPKPGATDPGQKYEFDVGLHYVGEMYPGSPVRNAMDFITGGKVQWAAMPDPYDIFHFPGFQFAVPVGKDKLCAALVKEFPSEKSAILAYFSDLKRAQSWLARHHAAQCFFWGGFKWIAGLGKREALQSLKSYLDRCFQDQKLKAVVAAQWGDHGNAPARCPFVTHSLIVNHYLQGGFYPVGGSSQIGKAVGAIIEENGGQVLLKKTVKRIQVESGKAVGVETEDGQIFLADKIFSNLGLVRTYQDLLDSEVPKSAKKAAHSEEYTVVTLYLGLKEDPKKLGFFGENHWIFSGFDHDEIWDRRDELASGKAHCAYLSFPSMKDPNGSAKTGLYTAELIAPISRSVFSKWNGTEKSKRGDEYLALKKKISQALLTLAEATFPGFTASVDFQELATPLTIEHYTSHPAGTIYGTPAVRERYESGQFRPQTNVNGLYLCGTDAASHGIAGALSGGLLAAGAAKGWMKAFRVFGPKQAKKT